MSLARSEDKMEVEEQKKDESSEEIYEESKEEN